MATKQVTPVNVRLNEADGTLKIEWSDESANRFALSYLRGWCPCAACQGHFSLHKKFITGVSVELDNAAPVGSYGMRLEWKDGHTSGIYAFEYLQQLAAGPPDDGPTNEECLGETEVRH